MTKTALANREMRMKEDIASKDRLSKEKLHANEMHEKRLDRAATRRGQNMKMIGDIVGGGTKGFLSSLLGKNDPAWYKNYIKEIGAYVNVPHYDRLGTNRFGRLYQYDEASDQSNSVPGIMTFWWIPTSGPQFGAHRYYPVNESLARMKEKVLALNSRSNTNWEPSDLGYNFFCSADILVGILELRRVILVYNTYYGENRYFAEALIKALGWSYSDVVANIAEYRKTYLKFAKKFNSSVIAPKSASIFQRRAYLATNIFSDSGDAANPRQIYAFVESYHLSLDTTGEKCNMSSWTAGESDSNYRTLEKFTDKLTSMFSNLVDNPDFVEMYQDLRHAFTDLVTLEESILGDAISINVDELNRHQIHNMKILPAHLRPDGKLARTNVLDAYWGLSQDTDGYLFQGGFDGSNVEQRRRIEVPHTMDTEETYLFVLFNADGELYNMYKSDITGDDILDITRFNYSLGNYNSTSDWVEVQDCGSEVVTVSTFKQFIGGAAGVDRETYPWEYMFSTYISTYLENDIMGITRLELLLHTISNLSAFDWAPICHISTLDTNEDMTTNTIVDTYTTFKISRADLQQINSACIMSEVYVPDESYFHR